MNEALKRLADYLGEGVSAEDLARALYAVRAPYCLTAIIPAARQFRDWRRKYPALDELPSLPQYAKCLEVLDRIADLEVDDDELTGRRLASHRGKRTPLRPYSGDSCICELLLVSAGSSVDTADFERASVWLLWHFQRFHVKDLTQADYRRYLAGEVPRLNRHRYGGRLYRAWLALRSLDRSRAAERLALGAIARLADELSPERSKQVAVALERCDGPLYAEQLAKLLAGSDALESKAADEEASTPDRPREQLNAVATLLLSLWDEQLAPPVRRRRGWLVGQRSDSGSERPQLRRGERLTEMLQRVDGDNLHSGTVFEFFVPGPSPHGPGGTVEPDDDDPEEEEAGSPAVTVFLADTQSLIRGFYASRGLRNALEYQNALLRWNKSTLSIVAIHAVNGLILGSGMRPSGAAASLNRAARLAIGLSLVTGRPLAEVARPLVANGTPAVDDHRQVGIGTAKWRVYVRPGHPSLKRKPAALPPFCHPVADALSLPLPAGWRTLVERTGRSHSQRKIAKRARALLLELGDAHPTLRITEAGVRDALIGTLADRSGGDLGLLAAVTGGADANGRNVIHYASYPLEQVESLWRDAVESLVGPLPRDCLESVDPVPAPAQYVGAQHAFDLERLSRYFSKIRERFQVASAGGDWLRAYNLLTLYLSYWLGLGLAQRKTLTPVPRIFLENGWVLVADKHRDDGTTDRLVPTTPKLRAQINAWMAFTEELSIAVPGLDPIITTPQGCEIRMQYVCRDKKGRGVRVVRYRPRYQELDAQLTALPANWGRKVARSESGHLPGRYRDAELGHFVRGRHAWDSTSTLDAQHFRGCWQVLQVSLEEKLGLEVMAVANSLKPLRTPLLRPGTGRIERRKQPLVAPEMPDDVVEGWLRDADETALGALEESDAMSKPRISADLVRGLIHAHKLETVERQRYLAEAACNWVRKKYKIPLFVAERRALPGNQVMLSADDLRTLAYLEQEVFTAFRKDLEQLPPRKPALGRGNVVMQQVELGRLIMLGIWRLGLASWPSLASWIKALQRDRPVLAQGPNRYMVFRVKGRQARDSTVRTVFLDDFTSAYLAVGWADVQETSLPYAFRRGERRARARVQTALQAYLRYLGAGREKVSLAAMLGAATQWIILRSAPIVAAYASGTVAADDLGDAQLRRLGGLKPLRKRAAPQDDDRSEMPGLGGLDVPTQLLGQIPIMRAIGRHSSANPSEWRRLIRAYHPKSPLERLLCSYALWSVDYSNTRAQKLRFSTRRKDRLADRIKVIAYAFLGYAADELNQVLDGDVLAALQEASQGQFPDRLQHGAWYLFDQFLRDRKADHAGFAIGKLGPKLDRSVSAKILSTAELEDLRSRLTSARSRIGNPLLRQSALRHVDLMATFGMRRSESAYLRTSDYQHDACRVQAYGEHTLKTPWADRVLPMGFALPEMRAWIGGAQRQGFEKLIDPSADERAVPDNFFDSLSRLIKAITGDPSMGSHHLRHTLASRMVLTLLRRAVYLDGLIADFPWLDDFVIDPGRMQALLGEEGDAGQGLRALAALIGHSHPTTTLRHYVHVLSIALHGALRKGDTLDMSRSFEHRIGGKSTVQRWMAQFRAATADLADTGARRARVNRALRDRIERRFRWVGIDRDERQREVVDGAPQESSSASSPDAITFDRLELADRSLRTARDLLDAQEVECYRQGLRWLKIVGTGKKGKRLSRHPLEEIRSGVWLPAQLSAGTATEAAVSLCAWLESMRTGRPEDLDWLLEKWVYASEQERGRMRLDNQGEVSRACSLSTPRVDVKVKGAMVANNRKASAKSVPRMRIKCLGANGEAIVRDTKAVRWVLSYVAASRHARLRSGGPSPG